MAQRTSSAGRVFRFGKPTSAQGLQTTPLELLDGSHGLAQGGGDLFHRQVTEDAKGQHVPLVRGEGVEQRPRLLVADMAQRRVLGARGSASIVQVGQREQHRAAATGAQLVDKAAMGNGEYQSPEGGTVTREPRQGPERRQEHLASQVLGFARSARAQEAEHGRGECCPDVGERPCRTFAGSVEQRVEVHSAAHETMVPYTRQMHPRSQKNRRTSQQAHVDCFAEHQLREPA